MKCVIKQIPKLIELGIVTFQITKMPKTKKECIIFDAVARQSRKYGYFLVLKSKKFQDRMYEFTCFDYKSYISHAHVSMVMKLPQPPYPFCKIEIQLCKVGMMRDFIYNYKRCSVRLVKIPLPKYITSSLNKQQKTKLSKNQTRLFFN